jgi:subtilisin family serine protease
MGTEQRPPAPSGAYLFSKDRCVRTNPLRIPLLAAAAAAAPAVGQLAAGPGADAVGGWASDRVLVKLASGASVARAQDGTIVARDVRGAALGGLQAALGAVGATNATRASTVAPANAARARAVGLDRWFEVSLPAGSDAAGAAARLAAEAGVEVAEVVGIGGIAADAPAPNDPGYPLQWALENVGQSINGVAGSAGSDIGARAAWHVTTGRATTVIAVLDSGLDAHVDYADRLLPGRNIPAGNADTADQCGSHGTHCAGIAAARGNDGVGIAGLDWNARILPVTVLSGCSGFTSWLADGVIWAADNGADVMNLSLQYSVENQYLRDAIAYAMQGGSVIVAAAGNTGTAGVAVPARWPEVIAVASLNSIDSSAPSSAVGPQLDFAAPGVAIYSCVGAAQLDFKSGTSMAAPHVAGTIALMRGIAPGLAPAQLEALVRQSCIDVMNAGFDNWSGWGRIDAGAAVRLARAAVAGDLTGDGRVDGADLGTMLGAWGTGGYDCLADFDDNGTVGGSDLGVLLGAWGTGY